MPPRTVREEIKQSKPFASLAEEVFVTLMRTTDDLGASGERFLRGYGITATQYNVLRILRGSLPDGLPCSEIGRRMVSRVPDVTRLLDRMEDQGLVDRQRRVDDRRVVHARLTSRGLELVNQLDQPMAQTMREMLGHMSLEHQRTLIDLLNEARSGRR